MKTLTIDERIERLAELKRNRDEIDREIMDIFATTPAREQVRRGRPRKEQGTNSGTDMEQKLTPELGPSSSGNDGR